jgi:hypothetical protein
MKSYIRRIVVESSQSDLIESTLLRRQVCSSAYRSA